MQYLGEVKVVSANVSPVEVSGIPDTKNSNIFSTRAVTGTAVVTKAGSAMVVFEYV